MKNFESLEQLKVLIEAVKPFALGEDENGNDMDIEQNDPVEQSPAELDPEHFKAFVKSPSDIDDDTIKEIADLVDGKMDTRPKEPSLAAAAAPATIDRIMNSISIVYITEDDIPVGVITLVDPTIESFQGIKPIDTYTMFSGFNLDGRVQQEFFTVADDYTGKGVDRELVAQLNAELDGVKTFMVVDETDKNTISLLHENGYRYLCTSKINANEVPTQLWVNGDPKDQQPIPDESVAQPESDEDAGLEEMD